MEEQFYISTKTPPLEYGVYLIVCKYATTGEYRPSTGTWMIEDGDGEMMEWEGIEWWYPLPSIPDE